jgi:hypothetical protein
MTDMFSFLPCYSSSHKYVPIGYKYISGIRTNHFDNFVNVLGEVKRKN